MTEQAGMLRRVELLVSLLGRGDSVHAVGHDGMGDQMTEQEPTVWDLGTLTSTEADVPVTESVAGATVSVTPTEAKRLMHIEKSGPAFSGEKA